MELYDHQKKLITDLSHALRDHQRVICQLPTGGGKTVVAGYIAKKLFEKGRRILILMHRRELVKQFHETLDKVGLANNIGIVTAGRYDIFNKQIRIASVQTLVRRLPEMLPKEYPDWIFVDECHHATAKTYTKIINKFSNAKVIGLTATPHRIDGVGLGNIFEKIVCGQNVKQLIANKKLCDYELFSPVSIDMGEAEEENREFTKSELEQFIAGKAIMSVTSTFQRFCKNKKTIIFTVSRKHSQEIKTALLSQGVNADVVDGAMDTFRRDGIMEQFRDGNLQVIINVDIISEGFDTPACDCVLMARPTKSLTLYMQQAGRALRFREGKTAMILDCAGNVYRHGLVCDERKWSLVGNKQKKTKKKENLHTCLACFATYNYTKIKDRECPICGAVQDLKYREVKEIDVSQEVELQKVKTIFNDQEIAVFRDKKGSVKNLKELKRKYVKNSDDMYRLAEVLGYRRGWADRQNRYRSGYKY